MKALGRPPANPKRFSTEDCSANWAAVKQGTAGALNSSLGAKDPFAALSQTNLHQTEPLGWSAVEACGRGYRTQLRPWRGNNRPNDQARVPSVTARPRPCEPGFFLAVIQSPKEKAPVKGPAAVQVVEATMRVDRPSLG